MAANNYEETMKQEVNNMQYDASSINYGSESGLVHCMQNPLQVIITTDFKNRLRQRRCELGVLTASMLALAMTTVVQNIFSPLFSNYAEKER